ncbi:MAG TPA: hypothetical protein VKB51_11890 [bacterium]|nr:hypothetical protein [bacterium]
MLSRIRAQVFIGIVVAFLAASCGGNRILITPPAEKVKKVALVSVTAQRGIRNLDGGGGLTAGLSAMSSMMGGNKKDGGKVGGLDFGGTRLVDYAVTAFEQEINKVPGWQVVPTSSVIHSQAYTKFAEGHKTMMGGLGQAVSNLAMFGPEGMVAVYAPSQSTTTKQLLTELAQDLNVDAVAVLDLDIAYKPYTAIGGSGTAVAAVGEGLVVVNRFGDYAIIVEPPKDSRYRENSEETTAMLAGEVMFNDNVEAMYKDSIHKGLSMIREDITADLQKK